VNMRPDDYVHAGIASDLDAGVLAIKGMQFLSSRYISSAYAVDLQHRHGNSDFRRGLGPQRASH
jgi:hypothetical protein